MILIKDKKGNTIYTSEINVGAKRKLTLMSEDYVMLPFSLSEPIEFGLGTYVEIEEGLFEVTENQKPTFNNSTGGYDYQLRLDAYYWKWKNKIFKFTPEVGGQEASWSLTASLDVHMGIFLKNLEALGYTYKGIEFEFSIDATVENKAISLVYENTNMIDALSAMAEAWECEWWITDNIINFGRCEYGSYVDFEIGKNVQEMTRTESKSTYATRLYVFGSTRNIPTNYRPTDESFVVNGIVQKRLMLPKDTPYIDAYEGMSEEEAIEEVVVIEDIYPKTDGNISSVETYTDSVENEDGTTTTETFYRFKDDGFHFSNDYILEGQELKVRFESGSLNGMEFGLVFNPNGVSEKLQDGSWNPEAQLYEVVVNEDYGRRLPDNVLNPKVGDKYVLLNWDSTKIADLGLIEKAEKELLEKGKELSEKKKIDPNTYGCKMMPDYMFGLNEEGEQDNSFAKHFGLGDRVNLVHPAYFKEGRKSRIIGIEYNLDYPFDNPVYTVGETGSYSRIGALEEKLDSISFKGQTYVGGSGSGVYVIGTNDTTSPTDRNVYSALMSDKRFLRKDKSDSTAHNLGVGSLTIKGKQISNLIRLTDVERPEQVSDADVYTALMTDKRIEEEIEGMGDKYLRKDKEDTAHKHITFEEGITVYQLARMMNLEVDELATIAQAVVDCIGSANFVPDFGGFGYQIWKDIATGDWSMHLDTLTVRKYMRIFELIIQKIRSAGGMIVVSAANGKVKEVERVGLEYKFTFEDSNMFVEGDLMCCQVFSGNGLKHYWVEVTRVEGDSVFARVADFNGQIPEVGDECVLMGNTTNVLRQNMIIISATDNGQPMFSCYNGIDTQMNNFEGHLRTRVGSLDGIRDNRFPNDLQPKGYGLYADNCYLTGVFVLSNGNEVSTQFTIMEGMLRSEISSVRAEINAKDNYLSNASFASNLDGWEYSNNVRLFDTSGGLLHFNNNFYSIKENFAGVVVRDSKNVLRIKKSFIMQKNEDYNLHPSFDEYENEETGEKKLRPRMFYVSFKYMCVEEGYLKLYFKDETNDGSFEEYEPLKVPTPTNDGLITPNVSFTVMEVAGKWNGTGDFYLEFDGDIYIYDLALSDNALADVEEKFTTRFEQTDKKIQANADAIVENGKQIEEYHSEFVLTADSLRSEFNKKITDTEGNITKAYTSKIEQTAETLQIEYKNLVSGAENRMYIYADGIKTDLTRLIENTEDGLREDYEADIDASYERLTTNYEAAIQDLRDGTIDDMQTSINQNARQISLRAYQTDLDDLGEVVDGHYAEFTVTKNEINSAIGGLDDDMKEALDLINKAEDKINDAQESTDKLEEYVNGSFKDYVVDASEAAAIQEHLNTLGTDIEGITSTYNSVINHINLSGTTEKTLLTRAYSTLMGAYYSLETTIKEAIGDGEIKATEKGDVDSAFDNFNIYLDSYNDALEEARYKISSFYANKAVETAEQALYDALPEDWKAKDGTYASSLVQMAEGLSAVAARYDELGNLIEGAGWVTTSEGNTLWAGIDLEDGNKIISYINQTATTTTIKASKIDLIGQVSFSMLDSNAQDKIDGKLDESTIISGNYIKTSLIDADSLVVKKLVATSGSYTYTLDSNGFVIKSSTRDLAKLHVNNSFGYFNMDNGSSYFTMNANSLMYSDSDGITSLSGGGLLLSNGAVISGLAVEVGTSLLASTGFIVISSSTSLPSPSSYKGRVIFVKFNGEKTLSGTIFPRHSTSIVSSVTHNSLSAFYISNGSYWYEFLSVD